MGGCFVQTAAGGLCSSRVSRLCALSLGGVRQRGAEAEGEAMPLRLARTQPRLKQRGERPAHLPDPLCARPAPARPTHAMSSASPMHVHVHIPQDHPSPVHVLASLPSRRQVEAAAERRHLRRRLRCRFRLHQGLGRADRQSACARGARAGPRQQETLSACARGARAGPRQGHGQEEGRPAGRRQGHGQEECHPGGRRQRHGGGQEEGRPVMRKRRRAPRDPTAVCHAHAVRILRQKAGAPSSALRPGRASR